MKALRWLLVLLVALGSPTARAALTEADLAAVELAPPPGARLPPDLVLVDESGRVVTPAMLRTGRPAVLVLADFDCATLCGTALGMLAGAMDAAGLTPGADYDLLVLGIDPRDGPVQAAAARQARFGRSAAVGGIRFLSGDAASLEAAQAALGYRARYDAEADAYAHPLGALVLTPEGRVSRTFAGLRLEPADLRLAVAEAAGGTVGVVVERLRLLCYGLDPAHGVYNALVKRALAFGTAATLLGLGGFILLLNRRRRRA